MRAALMSLRLRAPLVARAAAAPRFTAVRSLHVSARRLNANANPNANSDPEADPQLLALRQKIENHQGSREAIIKLSEIMAKKGVDMTKTPSTMQLMKLGMDAEIREAGSNLMAQLKEAGVEMTPEIASQIFSKVVKD